MDSIELYTYCKSSAAYRVRIALNLKKIHYRPHFVSLLKDGGENYKPEYKRINPQAMVPSLVCGENIITQSTAIIEWLEENYRDHKLLPPDSLQRSTCRSYAQMIACDIHPLNNLRVLDYIKNHHQQSEQGKLKWYQHWIHEGFDAIENRLANSSFTGAFCIADTPGYAEAYLVPQVYNAYRYECTMDDYPIINRIYERCLEITAFQDAAPENQEDFTV